MFRRLYHAIRDAFRVAGSPKEYSQHLSKDTFETVLAQYVLLLVNVSVLAGVTSFLFFIGRAFFIDAFSRVDIQYARMINYATGVSVSVFFVYVFTGTILVFVTSLALKVVYRRKKQSVILRHLFLALSPLLLLGWIPFLVPGLVVWSIILFIMINRSVHVNTEAKKFTIEQRE